MGILVFHISQHFTFDRNRQLLRAQRAAKLFLAGLWTKWPREPGHVYMAVHLRFDGLAMSPISGASIIGQRSSLCNYGYSVSRATICCDSLRLLTSCGRYFQNMQSFNAFLQVKCHLIVLHVPFLKTSSDTMITERRARNTNALKIFN